MPKHYVPPVKVPGTSTTLLTDTSKMPCVSWSLPAGESCPWALYGEGAMCEGCYAQQGSYTAYPNVLRAQRIRYAWVQECLKTPEGVEEFVSTITRALEMTRAHGARYFRVHDAGDLFSPEYTLAWVEIVRRNPGLKFWFPTRSWRPMRMRQLSAFTRMQWEMALMALGAEPNVTLRPSALFVNVDAPSIPGLAAGSGAKSEGWNCPASQQNNECRDCTACWDMAETPIYYHLHGTTKAAQSGRAKQKASRARAAREARHALAYPLRQQSAA